MQQDFSPEQPTAWLAEGLLVYLAPEQAGHVLAQLTGLSAVGSTLGLEQGASRPAEDGLTKLWQGGVGDPAGWLEAHGWQPSLDQWPAHSDMAFMIVGRSK